ncbi:MAG: hypothetical protein DHS20C09_14740 [marine bacterium B5-7]|nr:MAG: hypothetical protein DHS20C09_14740 [marine bacterium B5-7]
MKNEHLNRREFLCNSGKTLAGVVVASSGAVSLVFPTTGWSAQLAVLNEHESKTLLNMTRLLFPHDKVEDKYYAVVVKALDDDASASADTAKQLKAGVANLDKLAQGDWNALANDKRSAILKKTEDTAFFQQIRSKCVTGIYNNKELWPHFGYEGASAKHGGYINRGFDDLDWLPNPPESDSPKAH